MNRISRIVAAGTVAAITLGGALAANADDMNGMGMNRHNAYTINLLVSDLQGATVQDPNLKNAWGVAFSPAGSPFWINDNATGLATLYNGDGSIVPLVVTIPCPPSPGQGSSCPANASPTGIVWNPSSAFRVPGTKIQAAFIFDTEDGTISAWAPGLTPATNAVLAVDNSQTGPGAVYKGLAFGVNVHGAFLFATNFRAGTIDVFNTQYQPAQTDGGFTDPDIPPGFAPFGIQSIDGDLFVTYAKQNAQRHDDVAGPGNGFVDVFDTDGHLLRRLASGGKLNSPWGVARASFAFGRFSGDILIGNFGDGRINALPMDGGPMTQLRGTDGKPIAIDGLWTLTLGGGAKSSPDTLYFTAGPNGETDGLFGTITPMGRHRDQ
ncbi:MAG: TIGR03118 family protein [Stellaceae bacterium]